MNIKCEKTNFIEIKFLNFRTKRIQEHGLQNRENHLMYEKRPKCSGEGGSFVSVSMVDCYPALLVLSYGTIIAIVLLFIEIMSAKKKGIFRKNCHSNTEAEDK